MKYRRFIILGLFGILSISLFPCWRVQQIHGATLHFQPIWHEFNATAFPTMKATVAWDVMALMYFSAAILLVLIAMIPKGSVSAIARETYAVAVYLRPFVLWFILLGVTIVVMWNVRNQRRPNYPPAQFQPQQ